MNPVSVDIKDLLVDEELVYYIGDDPQNPLGLAFAISIASLPDSPINCVAVIDTGGPTIQQMFNKEKIDSESFQFIVRSSVYMDAWSKIDGIRTYIDGLGKTTVGANDYRYEGFYRTSAPLYLGKDGNQRHLFSLNYRTIRVL